MELSEYLAVPYVLVIESVERPDGEWVRRAEYPELPGCAVEAYSAVEAIAKLEEERVRCIQRLLDDGEPVPVPRPPLRSLSMALNTDRLGFARWLVKEGKLGEQ
jgi:predicted RNase H-like HicB family nuclease